MMPYSNHNRTFLIILYFLHSRTLHHFLSTPSPSYITNPRVFFILQSISHRNIITPYLLYINIDITISQPAVHRYSLNTEQNPPPKTKMNKQEHPGQRHPVQSSPIQLPALQYGTVQYSTRTRTRAVIKNEKGSRVDSGWDRSIDRWGITVQ